MDSSDLFRKEVMYAQTGSWLGSIRLSTPISHRLWTLAAVGIAVCILTWLFAGHYTRREHVDGMLIPHAGLLTVTARSAGTVAQLKVAEGSTVHAGDPLLTLSSERSSASLGDTSANITTLLRGQHARLQATLSDTQNLADQQAHELRMQQTMLRGELSQVDAQIAIKRRQAAALSALLEKLQPLREENLVSALEIQQQQSQVLDAESEVESLLRTRYDAQQKLLTATDQLAQLPLETQTRLSELRGQIAQTEQSIDTNEADRAVVLRAPVDGVVSSLLIKQGQAVAAGESLLAVVPQGSSLRAQLLVPSSAIGFVRVGTRVVLHYQAFPYEKFGVHRGTVESISRSALTPVEVTTLLGQVPPKEPLYRVQVSLSTQFVQAYGKAEPLKPGMALDANLMLDRRRLVEWMFEPVYGMARRFHAGINS